MYKAIKIPKSIIIVEIKSSKVKVSLRKITLMAWGFHSPKVITDGLQFKVNGFLHQGLVQVIYHLRHEQCL